MSQTYAEIIKELESRGIMPKHLPGIEMTQKGLARLKLANVSSKKVIVVGGTNGKGSVCAALERLILSTGATVGLYTSPHLIDTTERIRINGTDVTREFFCHAFDSVHKKTSDLRLSHFEMLTLMAMQIFVDSKVEWIILEVGLGGIYDSTNAIAHDTAILTSLSLDHTHILGSNLTEIAKNKFGIIPKNGLVVHQPFDHSLQSLVQEYQKKFSGRWVQAPSFQTKIEANPNHEPIFQLDSHWGSTSIPLPGKRGAENANLALTAFEALGFSAQQHLAALKAIRWVGRMEKIENGDSSIYLSGDHNPAGIESLVDLLQHYPREHLHVIAAVSLEKDLDGILTPLTQIPKASLYLTETPFQTRLLKDYGTWLSHSHCTHSNPSTVFHHVLNIAQPNDMILVTGSLYLVGYIRKVCSQ